MGEVDLCVVVQQIGAQLAPAAAAKNHTLSLDVCREHVPVRGNHDLLAIAVSNLLDNAIRYTPPGGNIEVQVFDDDGVGVRISNSGPLHASQDALEALAARPAAPTPDTPRSSASVGTGLGLAIAREVAARHGGKLDFQRGSPKRQRRDPVVGGHSAAAARDGLTHTLLKPRHPDFATR